MGSLLMQYEFQRASREVTIHQRAGMRLDNLVDKYTKRIENMQSVFQKAQDRMIHNYDRLSQAASSTISQAINGCASAANAGLFQDVLNGIEIGGLSLGQFVQVGNLQGASQQDILTALSTAGAQAKNVLNSLIEQAKEADLDRLSAQQDEQLYPISEKEADLEAQQNLENTLCEVWTTRRDNAKQRLGQDIGNSLAGYGLKS